MKDKNPNNCGTGCSGGSETGGEDCDHPVPEHPVLDHPVLDRSGAMRRLELDAESYGQLLALLAVDVAGTMDALTDAWRRGDTATMRLHAHRLKSEAANVGAEEVRYAASRLEWLLRQARGEDGHAVRSAMPPISADVSAEVDHLRSALTRLAVVLGR